MNDLVEHQQEELCRLLISPRGTVQMIYGEVIVPHSLGDPAIQRASCVEPDAEGYWHADLSPVGGPTLGPFLLRSQALEAENSWLFTHWLGQPEADDALDVSTAR